MTTQIEKWGNRNWAVWLILPDGEKELVCVTVYKKGALTVQITINSLIEYKRREGHHESV